jgi:hypothetical protein
MLGTAGMMILLALAGPAAPATGSGGATGSVTQVAFQDEQPPPEVRKTEADPAPLPPVRRLPPVQSKRRKDSQSPVAKESVPPPPEAPVPLPDETVQLPKERERLPEGHGIPGLPPLMEQPPASAGEKIPAPTAQPDARPSPPAKPPVSPPDMKSPAPQPDRPPRVEKPPATDDDVPRYRDYEDNFGEARSSDEEEAARRPAGGAVCTDRAIGNPADDALEPYALKNDWRDLRAWLGGITADGWIDQGLTINTLSPRNRSNGTVGFNDRSNEYQLNQLYARLRRDVNAEGDSWDIGGRLDMLYGTDWVYTAARGLELHDDLSPKWNAQRYGVAMPQCYMEAFCPWGTGLTMKLGHFYSPLGYESAMAPENFFYSHSYARLYAEPFTFTGLLGETKIEQLTIKAGLTRGFNNWEDNNDDLGFVGGVAWTSPNERTSVALMVDAAREQPDPSTSFRTVYSLVLQQKLGERWQCVLQHDLGIEPDAGIGGANARWYDICQYLFYTIDESWKAGLRAEWFRDENGSRIPGSPGTGDYYELSPDINWTPSERLTVRSELRWDWTGTPNLHPFGDHTRSNQLLWDCDVIVRF